MLEADAGIKSKVTRIYPIAVDTAKLPYIVYRRKALGVTPTKTGYPGADTAQIEVLCLTAQYSEGVELAESVRAALDCKSYGGDGIRVRGISLQDASEDWTDDAFVQELVFSCRM